MTEFQLLMLRRLDGVPRFVGAFGSGRRTCARDPALAERMYWATARNQNPAYTASSSVCHWGQAAADDRRAVGEGPRSLRRALGASR